MRAPPLDSYGRPRRSRSRSRGRRRRSPGRRYNRRRDDTLGPPKSKDELEKELHRLNAAITGKKVDVHIIVLGSHDIQYAGEVQKQFVEKNLVSEVKMRENEKLGVLLTQAKDIFKVSFAIIIGHDNVINRTISFKPLGVGIEKTCEIPVEQALDMIEQSVKDPDFSWEKLKGHDLATKREDAARQAREFAKERERERRQERPRDRRRERSFSPRFRGRGGRDNRRRRMRPGPSFEQRQPPRKQTIRPMAPPRNFQMREPTPPPPPPRPQNPPGSFSVTIRSQPIGVDFETLADVDRIRVKGVRPGSVGEDLGLLPGDLLIGINGEVVVDPVDLAGRVKTAQVPFELYFKRPKAKPHNSVNFNPPAAFRTGFVGRAEFSAPGAPDGEVLKPRVFVPGPNYRSKPCKYFSLGNCTKGDACTFSHDMVTDSLEIPCKYFRLGNCSKGEACIFSHDPNLAPVPCKYFKFGNCSKGEACPFTHMKRFPPNQKPHFQDYTAGPPVRPKPYGLPRLDRPPLDARPPLDSRPPLDAFRDRNPPRELAREREFHDRPPPQDMQRPPDFGRPREFEDPIDSRLEPRQLPARRSIRPGSGFDLPGRRPDFPKPDFYEQRGPRDSRLESEMPPRQREDRNYPQQNQPNHGFRYENPGNLNPNAPKVNLNPQKNYQNQNKTGQDAGLSTLAVSNLLSFLDENLLK